MSAGIKHINFYLSDKRYRTLNRIKKMIEAETKLKTYEDVFIFALEYWENQKLQQTEDASNVRKI